MDRSAVIDAVRRRAHAAAEGRAPGMTSDEHARVQAYLRRQEIERDLREAEEMRRRLAQQRALEDELRRRAAAQAPAVEAVREQEPAITAQDMADSVPLIGSHLQDSLAQARRGVETSVSETPPSPEWQRWQAAKAAADKGTGERSLLAAAKQYYLSQTEPDKYGEKFSEGDMTKLGLSTLPTLPFAGAAVTRPLLAGAMGAAGTMPDYTLGTSTAGDVALNAGLSAGLTGALNKVAGLFRKPVTEAAPELRTITQPRLPAPRESAALPAPQMPPGLATASQVLRLPNRAQPTQQMALDLGDALPPVRQRAGQSRADWLDEVKLAQSQAGGDIQRMGRLNRIKDEIKGWGDVSDVPIDVILRNLQNSYNRPFVRRSKTTFNPGEQMSLDFIERGRRPQFKTMSPQGRWVDDVPTEYAVGGPVDPTRVKQPSGGVRGYSPEQFEQIVSALEAALQEG